MPIVYEQLQRLNAPFQRELEEAFRAVCLSGRFILGEETARFEEEFAAWLGVRFCVGVSSGSDALLLAIQALDLPKGSEAIVAANAHISDLLAIVENGLQPVLVDPNPRTYNLDLAGVVANTTQRTSAIVAVHLYGKLCPMEAIVSFAKERGLKVIEDGAQAHGAAIRRKKGGCFGDVAAFSFYPTKNLGALGDGGAVVTDDPLLEQKIRLLRNYGSVEKNRHEVKGYNKRLDELQSAFLRIKLKHLSEINARKKEIATLYLNGLKGVVLPVVEEGFEDVWHIFPIRHERRDALQRMLRGAGIETLIHYPIPPYRQGALCSLFPNPQFPLSDEIHQTILSLPCSPIHSEEEIAEVIQGVNVWTG